MFDGRIVHTLGMGGTLKTLSLECSNPPEAVLVNIRNFGMTQQEACMHGISLTCHLAGKSWPLMMVSASLSWARTRGGVLSISAVMSSLIKLCKDTKRQLSCGKPGHPRHPHTQAA